MKWWQNHSVFKIICDVIFFTTKLVLKLKLWSKVQLFSPQFKELYFGTTKKWFKNDLKVFKYFFFKLQAVDNSSNN